MIVKSKIITDLEVRSLSDLYKLKPLIEGGTLKINKSQIARELKVDRRTVGKYINGFCKSKTRNCCNCITNFKSIISCLLDPSSERIFYYKAILYRYLIDNHNYKGSYANFCLYIKSIDEFNNYFKKRRPSNVNNVTLRFETAMGKQAQLDWKEHISFKLKNGEFVVVNVFVLLLSYSRYRVYRLSINKTQDILFNFLDQSFDIFGGIPKELLTDNMSTVMDIARTTHSEGKVNAKFAQFAKDYGFAVRPCIAASPKTKAKVEAPMKILDEIRAYNGALDYNELNHLITKINNRVNSNVVQGTGKIPIMAFNKEKAFFSSLPSKSIRKLYQIQSKTVKVNSSSMVNYKGCQYSVPTEYINQELTTQVFDGYLHIYDNTKIVSTHLITDNKFNYHTKDYINIAKQTHSFKNENIEKIAKENLELLKGITGHVSNSI